MPQHLLIEHAVVSVFCLPLSEENQRPNAEVVHFQFLNVEYYPSCCRRSQSMPWRCFLKQAAVIASSFSLLSPFCTGEKCLEPEVLALSRQLAPSEGNQCPASIS